MALEITRKKIDELTDKLKKRHEALNRHKEAAEVMAEKVGGGLVAPATAGALAFAQASQGGISVMGIPLDLGVGVVLKGLSLAAIGGKADFVIDSAANGALACAATRFGMKKGADFRAERAANAANPAGKQAKVKGVEGEPVHVLGDGAGAVDAVDAAHGGLTPEELKALQNR